MMKINANETKYIKFSVNVQGVDIRDLKGHVRLIKDDIEYGFPIQTSNGKIEVTIPPLTSVIKEELNEKDKFDAKLEVIANKTYLNPWADTVVVDLPMKVEAQISEEEEISEENELEISVDGIEEEEVEESCGKDHSKDKKKKKAKKEEYEPKSRFGKLLTGKK